MRRPLLAVLLLGLPLAQAQAQPGVPPVSKTACPASHPVKGNVVDRGERKGERIYHLPQSRSYKGTHPERCFKDAAEAGRAGYRPPQN